MINWTKLIDSNKQAVKSFAVGEASSKAFQSAFAGKENPARCAVREYGTQYARRLARKALRRRGVGV
jgi:hypothetical protein